MTAAADAPLKVLELASGEGASYAARLLGALGAQVVKLIVGERPSGTLPELDLKKVVRATRREDAVAAVGDLSEEADVVVWAGPASQLESEPVRMPNLRRLNPRLITASITPFGESGPHSHYQGTDLIAIHAGGLGYGTPPRVADPENEHPLGIPGDVTEPLTGLLLTLGILNALAERDADGHGRHVEVSAQEAVAALMFNNIATFVETGRSPGRLASDRPGARRQFLPCGDGLLVQMAGRPHHLRAWVRLLGQEARDIAARIDGGEHQARLSDSLNALADAWAAKRKRREITDLAQANHIPIEPVLNPAEVLECAQLAARGFWETDDEGRKLAGHPFGPVIVGGPERRLPAVVPATSAWPWRKVGPRQGPLSGIRVLDFTWVFAGPIASRVLAALGATVVKVEAREGEDEARRPFLARTLHGGKLSIVRDLDDREQLASVQALASEADIVIENFSTGVMEKHGLGWSQLSPDNPRLIMVSISGMGRTGPYAHHVMFGQVAQAYSGLTSIIGYEGGPPRGIEDGGFWSDPVTGYAAAAAALAALREREITGLGRQIDVSLVEATVSTLFRPLLAAAKGDVWGPRGNFHPAMAPQDVYRCAPHDGDSWLALACRTDEEFQALARLMGRADLASDPRFVTLADRQAHRVQLREVIQGWTNGLLPGEAAAACQEVGIPATPSYRTSDIVGDRHLKERGFFIREGDNFSCVALPWTLAPGSASVYGDAPRPGEQLDLVEDR